MADIHIQYHADLPGDCNDANMRELARLPRERLWRMLSDLRHKNHRTGLTPEDLQLYRDLETQIKFPLEEMGKAVVKLILCCLDTGDPATWKVATKAWMAIPYYEREYLAVWMRDARAAYVEDWTPARTSKKRRLEAIEKNAKDLGHQIPLDELHERRDAAKMTAKRSLVKKRRKKAAAKLRGYERALQERMGKKE